MQHIQDKDLDQLFKHAFTDAESPVPTNGWAAIAEKMDQPKKRKLPVFWLAAVSMGALLTITLLFTKEEKIKLHATQIAIATDVSTKIDAPEVAQEQVEIRETKRVISDVHLSEPTQELAIVEEKPVPHSTPTIESETMIAQATTKSQPTAEVNKKLEQSTPVEEVVYAQVEPTPINNDAIEEADVPTRGIRNVGDLVNLVVGKVDKREKKILRFNTNDDESSLIGFNIGFLKFNSKKHN